MVLGSILISFFYMYLSSFPSTTYWSDSFFSIVYSCFLFHRLGDHMHLNLSLDFLSCPDMYFWFCASTILSLLLELSSVFWRHGSWFLQLHFPFSRLLWTFGIFWDSIQIVNFFALILCKIFLVTGLLLFSISVVSDALQPHELQHDRSLCLSPSPGLWSNSCPLYQWCHPTISSCCSLLLLPSIFPRIRVFSNKLIVCIR